MLEVTQSALAEVRNWLYWAPDGVVGAFILVLAACIALLVHAALVKISHRILGARHPYLASVLAGTFGPTRFAILILALFIALPVAPFDDDVSIAIATVLLVAAIAVLGWIAIMATHISADIYLRRFRVDVADNLLARKHVTQVRVLRRVIDTILITITIGAALMTFEPVRQYGVSLFASAGVAGIIVGFAARPVLSNLIAGIQLAVSQPIRIDDAVIVENEFGRVEEITSTYVVLRLWDLRRMIVPLTYFIEKPFQNWTRESTTLIGAVLIHVDYTAPVERLREKAIEIAKASPFWDGGLVNVQVTDANSATMEVRVIATGRSADDTFNLRCEIREKLVAFLQQELPAALPQRRLQAHVSGASGASGDVRSAASHA